MCDGQKPADVPAALVMLDRALEALTAADAGLLPTGVQAQVLRALERAEARQTAARARVLAAFSTQDGPEADGQGSARVWLTWQTRVTKGAAAGAVGWARRLAAHPVIGDVLAAGEISGSWARAICEWSDRLPEGMRSDADRILAGAAAGGADLADLAGLAEEMHQRARPDQPGPGDDGFGDRGAWLDITFAGAGRLNGDLTPGCAAALAAVLEALGRKAGPEDTRTAAQRRHDALQEACRRLIASGMLPGRAGQPTQILVHMGLGQLRDIPGASGAEAAWAAGRARQPGWLTGPEADAAACDASIVPIVIGHVDPAALDHMAGVLPAGKDLSGESRQRFRNALLGLAADALSGPGGLAARLRAGLDGGPLTSVSLPLDIGPAGETIPVHLRRTVTARHPNCAFPGCEQPASVCEIHHLIPRSRGGPTALHNLVTLCVFHHLVAIHRWGWALVLHPDGTTTAISPDGGRVFHSHGPPGREHGPPGHAA